ncbi:surface lipoprotein assembly modifier [Ursidibacter sp. B-7004-1]
MNIKYYLPLIYLLPTSILAQHLNAVIDRELKVATPKLTELSAAISENKEDYSTEINDEQLADNPHLISHFLNLAIDQRQEVLIPKLIEMYRKYPQRDLILEDYAQGAYLYSIQDYNKAITLYANLLEKYPYLDKVRFKIAQWLFEDSQLNNAREQLNQLKDKDLPYFINNQISLYQEAIKEKQDINFNIKFSYIKDNNINNASSEPYIYIGKTKFKKTESSLPQKAEGIQYQLNINKLHNITDNHNIYFENELEGKYYWNNKEYNDINNTFYLGYQYQNVNNRFAFLPYYEKRWYAQKQYSNESGIRLEFDRRLSNQWQFSTSSEFAQTSYKNSNLKRNKQLYSGTLVHRLSPRTVIYFGSDILFENTQQKRDSSNRYSLRFGASSQIKNLFSTQITLQVAKRYFKGNDLFVAKKRKDTEWNLSATIWKKEWNLWGVTPKLNYRYQKINSNIPEFFSFDKHQLNLFFEKEY